MELHFDNISQTLEKSFLLTPEKSAIELVQKDEVKFISYKELYEWSNSLASYLVETLPVSSRVILLQPTSIEYAVSFFACMISGMVAVPCYPPTTESFEKKVIAIINDCSPKLVLTLASEQQSPSSGYVPKKLLNLIETKKIESLPIFEVNKNTQAPLTSVTRNDIAFLQYTSGTTNKSKGVILTHKNLLHNSERIKRVFGHSSKSKCFSWLPPFHDMGLIGGIIQSVYCGYTIRLMPPQDFIRSPARWLKQISSMKATSSGGPCFAYAMCLKLNERMLSLDLSSWENAFCGAEPIQQNILEQFYHKFSPFGLRKDAFLPCYGLAESTLISTGVARTTVNDYLSVKKEQLYTKKIISVEKGEKKENIRFFSCGSWDEKEQELIIVSDKSNLPLSDGCVGKIALRSNSVTQGYWPQGKTNTNSPFIKVMNKKYLDTGDLGFVFKNNLYVTGRLKDVLIIGGINYNPEPIEELIYRESIKLTYRVAAIQLKELDNSSITICIESMIKTENDLDAIGKHITSEILASFRIVVRAVYFLKKRGIPVTSSGKISRYQLKEKLSTSIDPIIYQYTFESFGSNKLSAHKLDKTDPSYIIDQIIDNLIDVEGIKLIDKKEPISSIFADSIVQMELLTRLEQALGISSLSIDSITESKTLDEFKRYVINELNTKSSQYKKLDNAKFPNMPMPRLFLQSFGNIEFNLAFVCDIKKSISIQVIKNALLRLIQAQSGLRSCYQKGTTELLEKDSVTILEKALKTYHLDIPHPRLKKFINEKIKVNSKKLDIYTAPLFKLLFITNQGKQYLCAVFNHMISDAVSLRLFYQQLDFLLSSKDMAKAANLLTDKVTQNAYEINRYMSEQRSCTKEISSFISDSKEVPNIDFTNTIANESEYRYSLPKQTYWDLKEYCKQNSMSFDTLLIAITLKSLNEQINCGRYLQVMNNGRSLSKSLSRKQHLIGWFSLGFPLSISDLNYDIHELWKKFNTAYQSNSDNAWAYNLALVKSKNKLISLMSADIEYSNLCGLTLETNSYFSPSSLYSSEVMLHGETFKSDMLRYRKIFIRPCLHNNEFVILFHLKNNSLNLIKLRSSLNHYFQVTAQVPHH